MENTPSPSTSDSPAQRVQELTELRQTNSETYLMSDGTYECVVYPENKYYPIGDTLELIDNTIKATRDGYTNTANAFGVRFSSASTAEVEMEYEGKSVTFTPVASEADKLGLASQAVRLGSGGAAPVLSQLTQTGDNTITYTNAFPGTDLTYVLANSMLKEYIILKDASAPNSFSFLFDMEGLTLRTVDGVSSFYDSDGTAVFTLSKLFAIDANEAYTEAVTYTISPGTGRNQAIITITLSEDFLSAENRVFPVVIDPTLTISSYETADASVCSATPNTNYQMAYNLRTGYEPDYGKRRSFIKFNIPGGITVNSVTSASLRLKHLSGVTPTVKAYRVLASWSSGTITWNNKPTCLPTTDCPVASHDSNNWYQMNVTAMVQGWVNGTNNNYGFMIQDVTEDDGDHWSTFYSSDAESANMPQLVINYIGYWGCKPYVNETSTYINCQGYAFFTNNIPALLTGQYYEDATSAENSEQLLDVVIAAMETWLDNNFPGKWSYGDLNSVLQQNQWLVAMRVGAKTLSDEDGSFGRDYHFWYRTNNNGRWANKHGKNASQFLDEGDLPTNDDSAGWSAMFEYLDYHIEPSFYDSDIVYYVITE